MNRVTLIGNLGRDPEVRRLENGVAVSKFSIATTEGYKDTNGEWQNQTEWHDIVVWRAQAELVEKTLKKGSAVYIEGKLTHRKYMDKTNIERTATEIVASVVRAMERLPKNDNSFPTQEPPIRDYSRPNTTDTPSTSDNSITQSVPFEVTNASEMKEATVMEAVSEPVGEDGLPF